MSDSYPPPDSEGRDEDRHDRPMPPPYHGQYGQSRGTSGEAGGRQWTGQQPQPGQPGHYPGYGPQQQPGGGGWGQPAGAGWQPQDPWGYGTYGGYGGPPSRPGTVLAGAIMSYVGSIALLLLGLLMLVGSASDQFLQGFSQQPAMPDVGAGTLRAVLAGFGVFAVVWSVLVIALAVFAQQRRNWARIALTVIGAVYLLFSLFSAVVGGTPQTLVGIVYVAIAITLFWIGGANEWYRAQR